MITFTAQLYNSATGAQVKWEGKAANGSAARKAAVAAHPGFRVLSIVRWET